MRCVEDNYGCRQNLEKEREVKDDNRYSRITFFRTLYNSSDSSSLEYVYL